MKLYMHPVSTTSRPVVLLAELAKIPLEEVVVDLMKGEHHAAPFVAMNPTKLVPVLDDEGFILTESSAILKYLAEKVGSPLYPKDLRARARVNERMDWFNTNFYRDWGYNLIYPQLFPHHNRGSEELTNAAVAWGKKNSAAMLEVLDRTILGSSAYVCGSEMTIADVFGSQLVGLGEIVRADFSSYPNVQRWLDSMKALPEWKKVNAIFDGFATSLAGKPFVAL